MSAAETWFAIAAVVAAVAALYQVSLAFGAPTTAGLLDRLGPALLATAIAVLAVGFVVAFP